MSPSQKLGRPNTCNCPPAETEWTKFFVPIKGKPASGSLPSYNDRTPILASGYAYISHNASPAGAFRAPKFAR
jgi:hypothetical protein